MPDPRTFIKVPGINWKPWGRGLCGLVTEISHARAFEQQLLTHKYGYGSSRTSGQGPSEYCEVLFYGPQADEVYLIYRPGPGQPKWWWQLVFRLIAAEPGQPAGPWQLLGEPSEQWLRPDSPFYQTALERYGTMGLDQRPVFWWPLNLEQLVRDIGATWDETITTATVTIGRPYDTLVAKLQSEGFEHITDGVYANIHTGQRLSVVGKFPI
jgi:hypothetical protein